MDTIASEPAANLAEMYHSAFRQFGAQCLWSRAPVNNPTIGQTLAVAKALRSEGGMQARALALAIEAACRAAL